MVLCWTLSKPHMLLKGLQVMRSVITSGTQPSGATGKVSTLRIICLCPSENVNTEPGQMPLTRFL